ncbi:helix-hairpin-helix domain-containing protein [Solirubrobacter taibaiensis]|nr:helix-hairpin-helix domain-containing protein [Solirubrobacter taibaiensis]
MPQTDPRRLAAWVAAGLILALFAAWYLSRSRPTAVAAGEPAVATIAAAGQSPPGGRGGGSAGTPVVVDVSGAVKRPGVYRLTTEDRVEDALKRAGGATRRADLSVINRASKLEDGRQILVPTRGKSASTPSATAATPATSTGPVNLNTATLEQLETLDGVGPATALKIVEYREQHGGFKSVDELDQVAGIGEKRLAALRDHVGV